TVGAPGDLDDDGVEDFAAGAPRSDASVGTGPGAARLFSGVDGSLLFEVPSLEPDDLVGVSLIGHDLTGDGVEEWLVGSPLTGVEERGVSRAFSFAPRRLAMDRHRISVDEGGVGTLTTDVGPALAGQLYIVLGTASGTSPGLPSPVGTLPINFDAYSVYTLSNPATLVTFNGFLDADGRATSQVVLPASAGANLAQFQLHYGCFTVDLSDPGFPTTAVTNAVPLGFDVDECTAVDPADDCNGNGVIDLCDILDGTSIDCDDNGVPDECQLTLPGADQDADGVLDACRQVVYVDADALGAGDGSSWADAYTELRTAIANAQDYAELWVAEGSYCPATTLDEETRSFVVRDGLALFGGFSGVEVSRDQRDWVAHPTILTGDILGDDFQAGGSTSENCWNVVETPETAGPTTRIEGFVIEGGNADEIAGCDVFAVFFSSCRGGGMYCLGSPTIRDCTFRRNFGGHHGGGIFMLGSPRIVDCTFESNGALRGGGLYADIGSQAQVVNCVVRDNKALEGAGVFALGQATQGPSFTNCLIHDNLASLGGGGLFVEGVTSTVDFSTIADNRSFDVGGGVAGEAAGSLQIVNSILWGNSAPVGSLQEQQVVDAGLVLLFSCIEGGLSGVGGVGAISADPLFVDPLGPDGLPGTGDEDYRLQPGSPAADAGSGLLSPFDPLDLDGDGVIQEALPLDLDRTPRAVDDPLAPNSGFPSSSGSVPDMGAYET
ncbi:MAG: right-handed parallel beta-helix repeat-containing protein, partial [Planctomycetota bacterium]